MGVFEQSVRSRVWRVLVVVRQLCCVVAPSRGAARVRTCSAGWPSSTRYSYSLLPRSGSKGCRNGTLVFLYYWRHIGELGQAFELAG